MATYYYPPETASGPRAKCDQVVFEAIAKACEIIVTSRHCYSDASRDGSLASAAANLLHLSGNSSRFNLHVPEVAKVRTILQRTRGVALHVPIRLDVFCEPGGGAASGAVEQPQQRLLLERWCLEYHVSGIENFLAKESIVGDAIVQLRHVCKKVVIWLRTLCCWIRLLPAQSVRANVGFSLYHHDDNVKELLQQGFLLEQPQSVVTTPYGELLWRVVYTPHVHQIQPATPAVARPIPIPKAQPTGPRRTAEKVPQGPFLAPRSAPQKAPVNWQAGEVRQLMVQNMNTYDPSGFHQRKTEANEEEPDHPRRIQPTVLRRRHTDAETFEGGGAAESQIDADDDKPPNRVLSGLSLALLEDSKRRGAFHELPPHLVEHQLVRPSEAHTDPAPQPPNFLSAATSNNASSTEYGYGYNGQIPWQTIHPSTSKPIDTASSRTDGQSPRPFTSPPLASTPPPSATAAFLGSPSPLPSPSPLHQQQHNHRQPIRRVFVANESSPAAPNLLSSTPPFRPRPVGLAGSSAAPASMDAFPSARRGATPQDTSRHHGEKFPAPLDSLDSSPFQQTSHPIFGSASRTRSVMEHASLMIPGSGLDLRRSLFASKATASAFAEDVADLTEDEELPFAVEDASYSAGSSTAPPAPGTAAAASPSSQVVDVSASAIMFAQRLGKPHARPAFASTFVGSSSVAPSTAGKSDVDRLAEELAEFRYFGASLNLVTDGPPPDGSGADDNNVGGGSSSTNTTATPIPLKT
jgi:hypothetical protein